MVQEEGRAAKLGGLSINRMSPRCHNDNAADSFQLYVLTS